MSEYQPEDFTRRCYRYEQDLKAKELDQARSIEVLLRVDGRTAVRVMLREPGIVAFISRPDDPDGFGVEVVEPAPALGRRYVDVELPGSGHVVPQMAPWQQMALFGKE